MPKPKSHAALDFLARTAQTVLEEAKSGKLPTLHLPLRKLENVEYDMNKGHFELSGREKTRALGAHTARAFAQTLRLMALAKEVIESGDFATKREAYYVSKNWGDCRFHDQPESDAVMDDIEALASSDGVLREELGFFPEEHAGAVAGNLTLVDLDPETSTRTEVDCTKLGSGAYSIPHSVERLQLDPDAEFVLAIETGGMFQRLNSHRFWQRTRSILVEMGGVPTRATRRFVRRLSEEKGLPVYCFVDCDPYGMANIYRTLKVGSGNAAHVSAFFSVPRARYLGVSPDDIKEFGLEDATHPLAEGDVKRARDALDNDPFFRAHPAWVAAIEQMLSMGVRAEQQALAKWGLNFVMDEYLPRKLAKPDAFLP